MLPRVACTHISSAAPPIRRAHAREASHVSCEHLRGQLLLARAELAEERRLAARAGEELSDLEEPRTASRSRPGSAGRPDPLQTQAASFSAALGTQPRFLRGPQPQSVEESLRAQLQLQESVEEERRERAGVTEAYKAPPRHPSVPPPGWAAFAESVVETNCTPVSA